jgi:hypothetical protein
VVPVARANLLAILNWIAAQRHSRTVTVAILDLIFGEPLLNDLDHLWFREKLVRSPGDIFLGEIFCSGKRLFLS